VTGEIAGLSRATVQRYVAAYRSGGLDGLRRWGVRGSVSELVAHTDTIREALTNRPVRTVVGRLAMAEARVLWAKKRFDEALLHHAGFLAGQLPFPPLQLCVSEVFWVFRF
jgi:hypothetical protein